MSFLQNPSGRDGSPSRPRTFRRNVPTRNRERRGFARVSYIEIARPSHWFKNIFILPGVLLAFFFEPRALDFAALISILLSLVGVCLVSSSNYVLNAILDAGGDAHHPDKHERPVPSGKIRLPLAYMEWLLLGVAGMAVSLVVNRPLALACLSLWIMGIVYNVPPIRLKDKPYLDVLSEAINNPIRMAIGWYGAGGSFALPALSVLLSYWMFGAFLMAVKRFAEIRHIGDVARAGMYRSSFRYYNAERLLVSILFYAALFGMFSGVFIARYRIELTLTIPVVALAMSSFFRMGFKTDSPAMNPEGMWRYPSLMLAVTLAFLMCAVLLFFDIDALTSLFAPRFEVGAIP